MEGNRRKGGSRKYISPALASPWYQMAPLIVMFRNGKTIAFHSTECWSGEGWLPGRLEEEVEGGEEEVVGAMGRWGLGC